MGKKWLPSLLTFVFWCLLGASIAYWLLHWFGKSNAAVPAHAKVAGSEARVLRSNTQTLTAALGGKHFVAKPTSTPAIADTPEASAPAEPQAIDPKRFKMGGILAQDPGTDGLVILSVDGKPAKLFSVGDPVADGVVLHSLTKTTAKLSKNTGEEPEITLEIGKTENKSTKVASSSASANSNAPSSSISSSTPSLDSFFASGESAITPEEEAELQALFEQEQENMASGNPAGSPDNIPPEMEKLLKALEAAAGKAVNQPPRPIKPGLPFPEPPPSPQLLLGQQPIQPAAVEPNLDDATKKAPNTATPSESAAEEIKKAIEEMSANQQSN